MHRHRIAEALFVLLVASACSGGTSTAPAQSTGAEAAPTVTSLASQAPSSGAPEALTDTARPAAPDITDARVIDDAIVLHVAKPHVSEAVEYYQVRVDEGTWRALDASEWRMARGEAGIVVTLQGLTLRPGQSRLVQLRAVSMAGFGAESRVALLDTDVAVEDPYPDDSGPVDVDSAMGLGGGTSQTPADPARRVVVIVVEVLAALGLVTIGVFIGRHLRRA